MNKYIRAISDCKIPHPKGYIGEKIIKHNIPFLKWEKHANIFYNFFVKKELRLIEKVYPKDYFTKHKKTAILISDDTRDEILNLPHDHVIEDLAKNYNLVIFYVNEVVENVIKSKNIVKILLIGSNVRRQFSYHIQYLTSHVGIDICIFTNPLSFLLIAIWNFKIPKIVFVNDQYYRPRLLQDLKACVCYSDFCLSSSKAVLSPLLTQPDFGKKKYYSLYESNTNHKNRICQSLQHLHNYLELFTRQFIEREQENVKMAEAISNCVFFAPLFSLPSVPGTRFQHALEYLKIYTTGIEPRKPFPGFNPAIYAQSHPFITQDPFVDFINKGYPPGAWYKQVMIPDRNRTCFIPLIQGKVALHIHIHYISDLPNIIKSLKDNRFRPDIYVTTTSDKLEKEILSMFRFSGLPLVKIIKNDNRGRDIAPFLSGILPLIHEKYEIIGHIHLKKSVHSGTESVKEWNRFLIENLVGSKYAMLDQICNLMLSDDKIGIVYPDDPNIYGWGSNFPFAQELSRKLDITIPKENDKFNFPAGSMFWARTAAILPLVTLNLQWADYPEEPVHVDGTILHALERLFGIVSEQNGYRTVFTHIPGISRKVSVYEN